MKLAPLALLLSVATSVVAQAPAGATPFTDPANLRGERVRPRDGRELPIDQGASGLQQMLRKLNTRASILNIVAHPDDEDGGMLTFYARGLGARVADLSLTRGEGGQNAMTGDFEDALGLLRTQELLANDRYTGVDQMFGTEVDFGFSKTKEEAFAKWTHQRVLYDAVRAIRLYRPLVITATFIGGVTDGHGQHQVSGEIAQEAFKAAGDPKVFPELTAQGILPWQPLKVYARVPMQAITAKGLFDYATGQYTAPRFTNYVTGEISTTPPTPDVVVHEGQTDPLLTVAAANPADYHNKAAKPNDTLTYVQFARIGLGLQRSQIGGGERNARAGVYDISFHRYGSMLPASLQKPQEDSFFDGIDTSIAGIANLAHNPPAALRSGLVRLGDTLAAASASFSPQNPQASAPTLADALDQASHLMAMTDSIRELPPAEKASILHEIRVKRVQINDALALALALSFDVTSLDADMNAGSAVKLSSTLKTMASIDVTVEDIHAETAPGGYTQPEDEKSTERVLTTDHADRRTLTLSGEETANITRPYFTRDSIEKPVYQLRVLAFQNAPSTPPALVAWSNISYLGVTISLGCIVHSGNQPTRFVPPLSLTLSSKAQVVPLGERAMAVDATVRSTAEPALPVARLHLYAPPKWNVKPNMEPMQLGVTRFDVTLPKRRPTEDVDLFASIVQPTAPTIKEGYRPVGYGDLPRTNYFTPASDRIVPVDLKLPTRHKLAYLPGTGDDVPAALASIGLAPTLLTVADLTAANLAQYDTVLLGVRTYSAHPDLHGAPTQALLDYARKGGNVVVQYQTTEFTAADAPYALSLGSNEKVVDETAPVALSALNAPTQNSKLDTDAAFSLLTIPNLITPADFNGWIEERGHGFLATWDPRYTALTETHDPGGPETAPQLPQRGGLITTTLGKGRWTYVAFALYRQLPEAVPGAYRLFINLINPPQH
jgi:LmbE family N-acetylglucosaminyl deacetylase